LDEINKYRELFFEESDEYLQTLNDALLDLEKNPKDMSILDEIFRAAHTLKGMAATMGYKTMAELTHHMENVLDLFRTGKLQVDSQVINVIFKCVDKLSEIVEDLREDKEKEYDIGGLLKELEAISQADLVTNQEGTTISYENIADEMEESDIHVIQRAMERDYKAFAIKVRIQDNCLLKGARAYLVTTKLEQRGDIIKTIPGPEDLEEGNFDREFQLIYLTKENKEVVEDTIANTAEIESVLVEAIEGIQGIEMTVRENLVEEVEEEEEVREDKKTHNINQSIRVDLSRLDRFMNLVSELVIYRTRLEDLSQNHGIAEISEPLEYVGRITSELQDLVLKIRMQPVNVVLNRFPRMVRDLSQELDKEIDFIIEGEDTELDRTIVSELGEPLVHLIRNAADHGIEHAEERLALGKPAKGLVKLTAYQEGNRVVIMVSDDGKGIDPDLIKASAEKKGIDTKGMGPRDLIQLIFHSGFSTVKEVTSVSGRGVGMDVVSQKISSLGGSIEVTSEVDRGTNFIIKLPLTLSIIQTLMVNVGEETFALPLSIIERVVKVEEGEIIESHSNEVYIYRDIAVPVIRVNEKLNIEADGENNHIILILLGDQYYGLLVNNLIGQQETVIKKLGGPLSKMREYLGATILGNGDIILILDVGNICKKDEGDLIE